MILVCYYNREISDRLPLSYMPSSQTRTPTDIQTDRQLDHIIQCLIIRVYNNNLICIAPECAKKTSVNLGQLSLSSLRGREIEYQSVWLGLGGASSLVSDGRYHCVTPYGK